MFWLRKNLCMQNSKHYWNNKSSIVQSSIHTFCFWHSHNFCAFDSLVKLRYFQFAFLENCVHKKQEKSIKDQRNFCSNAFFKMFASFVSAHSKIWCSRFIYEQNDINFFIPPVGDLLEIEECLYLTTTMESFQM